MGPRGSQKAAAAGPRDGIAGGQRGAVPFQPGEETGVAQKLIASAADPHEALSALIDSYVARTFDQPELEYVYYTERLNMSAADQRIVHDLQRSVVESWVELVVAVRPQWSRAQARFAVHAAMALVIDLGRLQRYPDTEQARAVVRRLVEAVLLGD